MQRVEHTMSAQKRGARIFGRPLLVVATPGSVLLLHRKGAQNEEEVIAEIVL